jgi:Tfp pilus assembly protein PilV
MKHSLSPSASFGLLAGQSGITLVEVLVAILITGVGLLAPLTLFPLGALNMAQAINDDRADAIAAQAATFSQSAEALGHRTELFARESLANGSVDLDTAAELRADYQDLALEAAVIEAQLEELRSELPRKQIQPHTHPLLKQLRWIERRIDRLVRMFSILDRSNVRPLPGH